MGQGEASYKGRGKNKLKTSQENPVKRLLLCVLMLLTLVASVSAQDTDTTPTPTADPDDSQTPLPLAVLMTFDPWAMVLGGDSPRFALYDDGTVIYFDSGDDEREPDFYTVQLTADELDELVESLERDDFAELDTYYDLVFKTDQKSHTLWVRVKDDDEKMQLVSVYGDIERDKEARDAAPEALLTTYAALAGFTHPDAEVWTPEVYEVMLWGYDTSDSTPWPKDFPDFDDPTTVDRDGLWSLYLTAEQYDHFLELAEDANAFKLDGKTYTFSVRIPFPNEAGWREVDTQN